MGERRHKDEVDSADDSDGARAEQEEVKLEQSGRLCCEVVEL